MSKRAVIITTSILVGIILSFAIVFGFVLRVKNINVAYADNFIYKDQTTDIIKASKLRKNSSIFGVDRTKLTDNIEQAYPYARVKGVNLSPTGVKITLSNRQPLYYVVEEAIYYILDEECKVLEITNDSANATEYILLNNVFSVTEDTTAGQFLDNKYTAVCKDVYKQLYSNATLNIGQDLDLDGTPDEKYLDRDDMCEVISSIKFTQVYELHGQVDKLIMTTSYGCNITIIEPQNALGIKINMAFSALRTLITNDQANGTDLSTKGTIAVRYSYDENNVVTPKCEYYAA